MRYIFIVKKMITIVFSQIYMAILSFHHVQLAISHEARVIHQEVGTGGRSRYLYNLSPMTHRNIMAAILQSKGPVITPRAAKSGWTFLNTMNSDQFREAAKGLETLNLGTLVAIKGSKARVVFVKKPPDEVRDILKSHEDLCPVEFYEKRYKQPVSKMITLGVRSELVRMRFLIEKQLK